MSYSAPEPAGFRRVVVIDTPKGAIRGRPAEFRHRGLALFPVSTATDALKLIGDNPKSIVVTHTDVRDISVADFLQIVTALVRTPVLVGVEGDTDMDVATRSLDCGARGLIPLPLTPSQLADAVRSIPPPNADGSSRVECAGLLLDTAAHRVTWLGTPLQLAPREFEVLAYLMTEHPRFISLEEVASHIGAGRSTSAHDRARHIMSRVRARLAEANPGAEVPIETMHRVGYRLTAFPAAPVPSPRLASALG